MGTRQCISAGADYEREYQEIWLIKLSRATMMGNQKGGACLDEHRISDPNPHDIETGYYGWHREKNSRESLAMDGTEKRIHANRLCFPAWEGKEQSTRVRQHRLAYELCWEA
jgi:hypothetical protein